MASVIGLAPIRPDLKGRLRELLCIHGLKFWRKASVTLRPRFAPILFSRQVQPAYICLPSRNGQGGRSCTCDLLVPNLLAACKRPSAADPEPIKELRRIFDLWKVQALIQEGYRHLEDR